MITNIASVIGMKLYGKKKNKDNQSSEMEPDVKGLYEELLHPKRIAAYAVYVACIHNDIYT